MSEVGAVQQGVISTQIERVQSERPAVEPQPPVQAEAPEAPPPPPADTGRGTVVDTSA